MRVILDSNVYLANISFKKDLRNLGLYLKNIQGEMVLLDIVQVESTEVYRRKLQESQNKLKDSIKKSEVLKWFPAYEMDIPEIPIDYLTEQFSKQIKEGPGNVPVQMFSLSSSALTQVFAKAAHRVHPISSTGHNFRDAMIWHGVIEYAQTYPSHKVIFISMNTLEFAEKDQPSRIHRHLQDQLDAAGINNVYYYPDILTFLKSHLRTIPSISVPADTLNIALQRLQRFREVISRQIYEDDTGWRPPFDLGEFSDPIWSIEKWEGYEVNSREMYLLADFFADFHVDEIEEQPIWDDKNENYKSIFHNTPKVFSMKGMLAVSLKDGMVHEVDLHGLRDFKLRMR